MKGIILAGGSGTRLHPITLGISKQLMPIYDKPMVYYPLTTLIQAGISEILVITTPEDQQAFQRLLGTGEQWGISLSYAVQPSPDGLAQALVIGRDFIGNDDVALVLGDNIFDGSDLDASLQHCYTPGKATVFAYEVSDPQRYGVVNFDDRGMATAIEEKPAHPTSNFAIVGLYFYPHDAVKIAENLIPSERGELEITALNSAYLEHDRLRVHKLERGSVWLDTGTIDSMSEASSYVEVLQKRTGSIIGSPEVAAWRAGFIDDCQLRALGQSQLKSGYGKYLLRALGEGW
ncbi:glucose-1-phosphate thymidylyltransferase RfbA [Corynebacterium ulcerans]|uniref:glucose-1-phosphate thymidylyltransferase RfbA n=1 Tax=Corynebacterium ulcerans TaxID=65058 RepID=UPI0034A35B94